MSSFHSSQTAQRNFGQQEAFESTKNYILTLFPHQWPGSGLLCTEFDKDVGKTVRQEESNALVFKGEGDRQS